MKCPFNSLLLIRENVFMRKIFIIPFVLLVLILAAFGVVYDQLFRTDGSLVDPISIELKDGEGVHALVDRLEEQGVIENAAVLRKYLSFKGVDRKIQTGIYTFTPPLSIARIAEVLLHPEKNEMSITVIPGWDLREITAYFVARGFGTEEEFTALIGKSAIRNKVGSARPESIKKYALAKHIPDTASLEGYLAPETYRVFANASAEQVVEKLFAHRDSQFTEQMYEDIAASKRSVHEIIIMASLLEREVRSPDDRKKVADLFWRRYDMGWALQADSTVHYIVNKKGDVYTTAKDRQTDSPWNTYKYPGLPEGPISTPSMSSIMAAMYPEKNDAWYFLTTHEGRVIYAKTLQEHNANKVHLQ